MTGVTLHDCERAMTEPVYWLGADGAVWKMVSFCDRPTATLERMTDGTKRGGAIGSRNLDEFVVLVPKGEA